MESITRKSLLYKTGVEYGDYTINHVLGCAHGCLYPCYAYLMKKRFGVVNGYEQWCEPKLVSNTLELLDTEIPRLKDKIKTVQLCFSTDPFMYGYQEVADMSLKAIEKLNQNGIPCAILTKGLLPFELSDYSKENTYGITLISIDEDFREKMEPGSASIEDRLAALRRLKDAGCKTWVSMEPYPTPNIKRQELVPILDAVSFVDKIIFGRMNYNKCVSEYKDHKEFYNQAAKEVIEYCNAHSIQYHIKKGTVSESQK